MKKRLLPFAAMAAILASCSSENVLETNPDPTGQALSFSIAVGHTRATETTIGNLGDFKVVAKGVHPHGGVYDNFLIGTTTDGKIDGEIAQRKGTNQIWELDRKVYWPTSIDNALFWAYTCAQTSNKTILPAECTFNFENSEKSVQLNNFSPAKSDLTATASDGLWADGRNQVDLLVAFTQAQRNNGSTVTLNFNHALSQMDIKATSKKKDNEKDHRIVYIKGAWIINTKDKANLISGYTWDNATMKATNSPEWKNHTFKEDSQAFSAYGSFYKQFKTLDDSSDNLNLLDQTLMLIPQEITAWDKKEINESNKNKSYILLLCRVELKHAGATHTDTPTDSNNDDDIAIKDNYHYHQMFPVNKSKKFVEGEYGFACVPVETTFEMGKKYIFNLDICGAASGAGNYPPEGEGIDFEKLLPTSHEFPSRFKDGNVSLTIGKRPTETDNKKNVGDPVLDEEIKFNVEVTEWGNDWIEGTVDPQSAKTE